MYYSIKYGQLCNWLNNIKIILVWIYIYNYSCYIMSKYYITIVKRQILIYKIYNKWKIQ